MPTCCSTSDPYAFCCVGLDELDTTLKCLKVSPFNLPSVDAREVSKKLRDEVHTFDETYFTSLNFDKELISVFGLSKFHEVVVSKFCYIWHVYAAL